ncbi:hypothetical protein [Gramella sp. AN32]|uniref:Apea-like HEPN domain-containing protein n=1 Tax=Christiangramia antarctica TaxID=2058158 RepID=A0ABW5X4P7_9FLAO|nr:hypothetical protein [Gramella sp. AN32]MCM4158222.1 hypothetical protein [Gramella sp. AN32]
MNNIEKRIEFWEELWEDLIKNFLKKSFGLNLYSPNILIDDIITEIEENGFKNKDNRNFFYKKISDYLENDEVINNELKSEFNLLRKSFDQTRKNYVLALCYQIRKNFDKGVYFNRTLEMVENLLLLDEEIDLDFVNRLNYYSQGLITEFVKKSYVLEDIKKFLKNIFKGYREINGNLFTDFPHPYEIDNFTDDNGNLQREEYEKNVKEFIDNLSIKEKIWSLKTYYDKNQELVRYIFYIKGIKGDIDRSILGVHFYNVEKRKLSTNETRRHHYEDLQEFMGLDKKYLQVAVEVEMISPKSSLSKAISKVENAINVLSCYLIFKTKISINDSNYVIINNQGRIIYSSFKREDSDSIFEYRNSLDFSEVELTLDLIQENEFLWKEENDTISKLRNALRWRHKAEESTREEDKLLNYWICLENLFNSSKDLNIDIFKDKNRTKFSLIQEIISSHQAFNTVYKYGWEMHKHFESYIHPLQVKPIIPEDLRKRAQLRGEVGQKIYLEKFIKELPELKKYESNLLMQEKIDSLIDFYKDSTVTKTVINENIQQTKDDLLMIYRLRNLIVHNAHYNNALLEYYVWRIRLYAGYLLRKFISKYNENEVGDFDEYIFEIFIAKEKLLLDLDKGNINLFEQ